MIVVTQIGTTDEWMRRFLIVGNEIEQSPSRSKKVTQRFYSYWDMSIQLYTSYDSSSSTFSSWI
jgi:hypothetical protein